MNSQRLLVKLESDWACQYFKTRSFSLPANKHLTYSAVENYPNDYFFNGGVSALNVNAGGSPQEEDIPYNQAATFIFNPGHIKGYAQAELGGKVIENFTEQEAKNSADRFIDSKGDGFSIITSGMHEYDDGNVAWAPSYNYAGDPRRQPCRMQYLAIDKQFSDRLKANGGVYFGGYDGHMGIANLLFNDINMLRQCFTDGTFAVQKCKEYIASGAGNPFFLAEQWRDRGGLINTYFGDGDVTPGHLASLLTNFHINNFALATLGASNTPMCSFSFLSKREFPGVNFGYSEGYRNYIGDGYMETYSFSLHSNQWQMFLSYISLNYCTHLFAWEDTIRRGLDKNVVIPDRIREDGFPIEKYYGNQQPQRAGRESKYVANRISGYLEMQYGPGHDAYMIGIENWCKMTDWASQNWKYARHRPKNGQFCSNDATYIVDRYVENQPVAIVHFIGRRRALMFLDVIHEAGTFHEYDIDIDGDIFSDEFEAGVPYFYLIDLDGGTIA